MRKTLLNAATTFGLLLFSAMPAIAAVGASDWVGPYAGVNAGYGWGKMERTTGLQGAWTSESSQLRNAFVSGSNQDLSPRSLVGGGQAGYNLQTAAGIVFGAEFDINYTNMNEKSSNSSSNSGTTYNFTHEVDTNWIMTVRPRVGYVYNDYLIYATGGLAVANVDTKWTVTSNGNYLKQSDNSNRYGYGVGAGVERAIEGNWTVRLEYLFTDFGSVKENSSYRAGSNFTSPAYTENLKDSYNFSSIRVGVNYNF